MSVDEIISTTAPHPVTSAGAHYIRARLKVDAPVPAGWRLTVRDSAFRPIQTLVPADFQPPRLSRWTERVLGGTVWLDLELEKPTGTAPTIHLFEYVAMPAESSRPTYYTVLNPAAGPQFYPLFEKGTTEIRRRGDPVGLLLSSWGTQTWCCSGVLVAPDLFLTNWHCGGPDGLPSAGYWTDQVCDDTTIDLSWDGDAVSREFACEKVELKDEIRDFALLRLRPLDSRGAPAAAVLRPGDVPSTVSVIHHPLCRPKQLTPSCPIVQPDRPAWRGGVASIDVAHKCDTEGGSSGAPVFNAAGEVVALHHHGRDVDSNTCAFTDELNKAVKIGAIVDFIRTARPDLAGRLTVR